MDVHACMDACVCIHMRAWVHTRIVLLRAFSYALKPASADELAGESAEEEAAEGGGRDGAVPCAHQVRCMVSGKWQVVSGKW